MYISGAIWADWVRLTKTLKGLSCARDKAQRLKKQEMESHHKDYSLKLSFYEKRT